jgi:hypothetical protein
MLGVDAPEDRIVQEWMITEQILASGQRLQHRGLRLTEVRARRGLTQARLAAASKATSTLAA